MKKTACLLIFLFSIVAVFADNVTGPTTLQKCSPDNQVYTLNVANLGITQWYVNGGTLVSTFQNTCSVRPSNSGTISVYCTYIPLQGGNAVTSSTCITTRTDYVVSISGTQSVCINGQITVNGSVSPANSSAYYQWTPDSKLQVVSGNGTSSVVLRGVSNGESTLSLLVTCCTGVQYTKTYVIHVGPPNTSLLSISGPSTLMLNQIRTWTIGNGSTQGINSFSWDGTGILTPGTSTSSNYSAKGVGCGPDAISCRVGNSCGISSTYLYKDIEVLCTLAPGNLLIYPQPANRSLNIKLENTENLKNDFDIKIVDLNQNTVYNDKFTGEIKTIDVSNIKNGTYTVSVQNSERSFSKTILIQH